MLAEPTASATVTRRALLKGAAAASFVGIALGGFRRAWAQSTDQATAFVDQTGRALIAAVNGNEPISAKRQQLQAVIDRTVDVDDVARFCLGRFWRQATPQQQQDYTTLFHQVLVNNITGKVGDYKGVLFQMGRSSPRGNDTSVSTIVTRPGNEPARVDWLVSNASGSPKIIDVIAEGTSLRLTQRDDYSAFLSRNNNNLQALIDAMRRQAASPA